jgi:hypothetical protein
LATVDPSQARSPLPELQLDRGDRIRQFAQVPEKFVLVALERGQAGSQCI